MKLNAQGNSICKCCYQETHPTTITEALLAIEDYCPQCYERKRTQAKEANIKIRHKVLSYYSGGGEPHCLCCGENREVFLTIDHVNNDGAAHRKKVKKLYEWLVTNKFPKGFQTLCRNCNWAKYRLGECPHETERRAKALEDGAGIVPTGPDF